MRLARKLGMITYRSALEWSKRFGRERAQDKDLKAGAFGIDFEIESYLESHANKFIGAFDPIAISTYLERWIFLMLLTQTGI